jgi:cell division protein DivIC
MDILNWLKGVFSNFYKGTLFVWGIWVMFFDNNSVLNAVNSYRKRNELERDTTYFYNKIQEARRDRDEVFGNGKMLEKWAREKYRMSKPTEDVYVIVDENNQSIETVE